MIPQATVEEIAYQVYLRRLEPPLTVAESLALTRRDPSGKVVANDAMRRERSKSLLPLLRDVLHVLVDLAMVTQ